MAEGQEKGHGRSWREKPVSRRTLVRLQEQVAQDWQPAPEVAALESQVGLDALLRALCQLAPLHRLLLLGSLWGQLTQAELASLLKTRHRIVAAQLGRAKVELRRSLDSANGVDVAQ